MIDKCCWAFWCHVLIVFNSIHQVPHVVFFFSAAAVWKTWRMWLRFSVFNKIHMFPTSHRSVSDVYGVQFIFTNLIYIHYAQRLPNCAPRRSSDVNQIQTLRLNPNPFDFKQFPILHIPSRMFLLSFFKVINRVYTRSPLRKNTFWWQ